MGHHLNQDTYVASQCLINKQRRLQPGTCREVGIPTAQGSFIMECGKGITQHLGSQISRICQVKGDMDGWICHEAEGTTLVESCLAMIKVSMALS